MTDAEFDACMLRMRQGDKESLKMIYQEYISFIYSVIYSTLQNKENAEDITSEFFIKLWENSDNYRPGGKHRGYMATIARNMAIDFLRKNRREQLTDEVPETADEQGIEEEVISGVSIDQALSYLKEKEIEVINLKIMGGFTFQEIADILGRPLGTVTWCYQNALKKLRRCGYEQEL